MSRFDLAELVRRIDNPAKIIDQTLLKPNTGVKGFEKFVEENDSLGFRALVVPLYVAGFVSEIAKTKVATVVGFPHGNTDLAAKLYEIEVAGSAGASEVDVVANIGNIVEERWESFRREVGEVVRKARDLGLGVKIIIETGYLSFSQIDQASRIVAEQKADYVKTSTGFGPRGASIGDVIIMKGAVASSATGVKASGGIRSVWDLAIMVAAGADIIGSSSGRDIVKGWKEVRSGRQ